MSGGPPLVVVLFEPEDAELGERVAERLREAGYAAWTTEQILVGDSLVGSLNDKLAVGGPVVPVLSVFAMGRRAIRFASEQVTRQKLTGGSARLLPVVVSDCDFEEYQGRFNVKAADARGARFEEGVSELIASLGRPTVEGEAELRQYLRRLKGQCTPLQMVGFGESIPLRLTVDDAYTPLQAMPRHWLPGEDPRRVERFGPDACGAQTEPIDLDDAVRRARAADCRGLVVLGDAGSGKTTLLRRYALIASDDARGPEMLGLPATTIPVLVRLRAMKEPGAGLAAAVRAGVLGSDEGATGLPSWLLKSGRPVLLLVDGIDEVPTAEARRAVLEWLRREAAGREDWFFVMTSRFTGYPRDAGLAQHFAEHELRPLAEEHVRAFMDAWFAAVRAEAERSQRDQTDVLDAAEQARAEVDHVFDGRDRTTLSLRELLRNPMMLQIVCLVLLNRKQLPRRRVDLYDRCLEVLTEHWPKARGQRTTWDTAQVVALLGPAALELQRAGLDEAGRADWERWFAEPVGALGLDAGEAARVLPTVGEETNLLVDVGGDSWTFLHRSFQEYLSARQVGRLVVETRSDDPVDELLAHLDDERWREVVLLAVGLESPDLFRPLVERVLAGGLLPAQLDLVEDAIRDALAPVATPFLRALADPTADPDTRYHALRFLKQLSGWREAEVAVVAPRPAGWWRRLGAALKRRPRTVTSTGLVIVQGLARTSAAGVASLARELLVASGERPPEPVAGQEWRHPATDMLFVAVPGGSFRLGEPRFESEREVDLDAFWLGKYPVTHAEYLAFVEASGRDLPKYADDKRFNGPQQPVVGVSWHDAVAFCEWAGLRLPSQDEWEAAARGTDGRRYPWGDEEPDETRARFSKELGDARSASEVGSYPRGAGPYGTLDQAGNVLEWCQDEIEEGVRALRGGCWFVVARDLAAAYPYRDSVGSRDDSVGFRCALSAPPTVGP